MDFPDFNEKTNAYTDSDNSVRVIVQNVQENNEWLEDIEEHRPNRQSL